MKIKKRGKTIEIKFDNIRESTRMLRSLGFTNIADMQTRVAEQRDAPVHAGQPCPSCNGYGTLLDTEADAHALCPECEGTGWANRPAGG